MEIQQQADIVLIFYTILIFLKNINT